MIGGGGGRQVRLLVETILVRLVLVDDHVHRALFARRSQLHGVRAYIVVLVRRIVVVVVVVELTHWTARRTAVLASGRRGGKVCGVVVTLDRLL